MRRFAPRELISTRDLLFGRIVELVFSGSLECLLDIGIYPKILNCDSDLVWHVFALDLHRQTHNDDGVVAVGFMIER